MKQKVLVIIGPTASGKSALGVRLAKRFNGEVISADSRQVYKGLDIGTGKITKSGMKGVRHHLLDVASPKKIFSAGDFVRRGRRVISEITTRRKLPIVVGGTGFYVDALVGRILLPEVPANTTLRKQLGKLSAKQLYARLQRLDPARARALGSPSERNNKVRLIRAIEVATALGKVPRAVTSPAYDCLWLGITLQSKVQRKKIEERLRARLRDGMISEARRLHRQGLSYKRMESLGLEYRSLARFLQGTISRQRLESELRSDIWRYSHKQLGYWKRNKGIRWLEPTSKQIATAVRHWLKK